jgi:hypothetical protein
LKPGTQFKVIRSALVIWLSGWVSWVNLCILWVLCWLTVVLGPPATFGLVYAANYAVHEAPLTVKETVAGARHYFGLSWLWMAGNLLVGAIFWASMHFFGGSPVWVWQVARPVLIGVGIFWLVVQFFALPYLIIQEQKNLLAAWKHGLLIALSAPIFTLFVAGLGLLVGLFSLILVAPLALGGPAFVAVLANEAVLERLKTYKDFQG